MANQEWRTVSYLPPNIEVSDEGNVRKVLSESDYALTAGSISNGVRMISVSGKQYAVHRLVADAFIPNPDDLPRVIHKDGNKLNNAVDNLERISRSDNAVQNIKNGTVARHLVKCKETKKLYASIRTASFDTGMNPELIAWSIESGTKVCGFTFSKVEQAPKDSSKIVYFSLDEAKDAASNANSVEEMIELLNS